MHFIVIVILQLSLVVTYKKATIGCVNRESIVKEDIHAKILENFIYIITFFRGMIYVQFPIFASTRKYSPSLFEENKYLQY